MEIVEMLKTSDFCPRCGDAKMTLTALGHQIVEITATPDALLTRADRDDLMAAIAENDGKAPLLRIVGTDRWFATAFEILQAIANAETDELAPKKAVSPTENRGVPSAQILTERAPGVSR